jgi:predicted dithiol-disulfide oxidoreductase (DUF899 family)
VSDLSDKQTVKDTHFSKLFETDKNCLFIYSFMYDPEAEKPCPICTSILDGVNGNAPHITDRLNFAVIARASLKKIRDWARERGWHHLRLLSSENNTYNSDYFAENDEWGQMPALNIFQKTEQGIFHFYNSELLYALAEKGQHARHADLI